MTDSSGNPVANAGATAMNADTSAFASTAADGTYEITVLPGTYKIMFNTSDQQVQWAHNKTSRATADTFAVVAGEVAMASITLTLVSATPGTATFWVRR